MFTHIRITDLGYASELPERLTRERYIRIYRKIFATMRHDLYISIQKFAVDNKIASLVNI